MTSPLQLPKSSPSQEPSPPQRPLCVVGSLGRKKQKARGIVHRALFIGIPSGSLCGGHSRGRTGDATPSGLIFLRSLYFALLLARVASASVRLRSKEQGTRVFPTGTLATHAMPFPSVNRVRWRVGCVASASVRLRSKEQGTRVFPTGTLATHAMPFPSVNRVRWRVGCVASVSVRFRSKE